MSFENLALQYGSGHASYHQADTVAGNSLTNPYLRMNLQNQNGVCLGLAMGFLLYSKRYAHQHPMMWISNFITDSRSGYEDNSNLHSVSSLQTFVGCAMEEQRTLTTLLGRVRMLQEGMWDVSLKYEASNTLYWGGDGVMDLLEPNVNMDAPDGYWLIGVWSGTGGHAVVIRSMVHPTTGARLLLFFEPNYGIVQFQGISWARNMRNFLNAFAAGPMGQKYLEETAVMYRFS